MAFYTLTPNSKLNKHVQQVIEYVKVANFNNLKQVNSYMKEKGFAKLGQGKSASTWDIGYNLVIRIEPMFQKRGYFCWLKYCVQNQDITCIPKIKYMEYSAYQRDGNRVLISIMEKLVPIKGELRKDFFKDYSQYCEHLNFAFQQRSSLSLKTYYKLALKETKKPKCLKLQDVIKIHTNFKNINDIHEKNMMFSRKKQRLVITDPLFIIEA